MPHRTLACILSIFVMYGCSASAPPDESPSCGAPIDVETVKVLDAEDTYATQDINATLDSVAEQIGSFQLISNQQFRTGTWPVQKRQPRWIHAREEAAAKGCDVLILVDSEMRRGRGGIDGPVSPTLHIYFLLGFTTP